MGYCVYVCVCVDDGTGLYVCPHCTAQGWVSEAGIARHDGALVYRVIVDSQASFASKVAELEAQSQGATYCLA